ncbi:MAG: hypothetical protein KKA67_07305 [Spirochaetes bacterium]|nr:hypothetical protein [Spirochaetota bacterium]
MVALSCVSEPPPAEPVAGGPVAAEPLAGSPAASPEAASVYASMRVAPPEALEAAVTLEEPALAIPPPASPLAPPVDITVLSTIPTPAPPTLALPEPKVPDPVSSSIAPPAPPAVAPPTVAKPDPAAPSPAPPKAAIPKPAAPKLAVPKPVEPKPVDAKPVDAKPAVPETPLASAEAAKPAGVLPAAPASSARSVIAAPAQPVAETRVETARGERFELRFPGSGWIYLGDEEGKEGLRYETRRFEGSQAVFALDPESVGEYVLRFQRQNPVDRSTELSLVRVVVSEKPGSQVAAAPIAPPAATAPTAASPVATAPVKATDPAASAAPAAPSGAAAPVGAAIPASEPAAADPASLLALAKAELEAKRVQSAIQTLDRYLSLYPYGNDEVFYLYGLAYEQDTPFRNVKKAYEYYSRVKNEYPRSSRWREAADRAAYLERHYFGLR